MDIEDVRGMSQVMCSEKGADTADRCRGRLIGKKREAFVGRKMGINGQGD